MTDKVRDEHEDHFEETSSTNHAARVMTAASDGGVVGYETDARSLPKGYFYSRFFLGTMLATGLGMWAATASFGYAAPILSIINEDIGPDARYTWVSLVYNTVLAVGLAVVGRMSDIFGRRYWFIGGGVIGVVGSVVCAVAKNIPTLIGGNVLLGLSSATQLSFHYVSGELLPMNYRYIGIACLYFFTFPGSGFAPSITYAFIAHYPSVGWRGIYWFLLAVQSAALLLWVLCYFPPSFEKKHAGEPHASKMYWIKHFDYIGLILFAGGFVAFLLGLSWGGSVYPWNSAATIAPIVIGFVTLIVFVLWEVYAPVKEPMIPLHLFRNRDWTISCVLLGLGAGVYYAFAIIWPMQAAVMYSTGDLDNLGIVSSIIGIAIIAGQIMGGMLCKAIGKARFQVMAMMSVGGVFLGCMAVTTPDTKPTAIALIFLGCFFVGWNESICLANATICVHDQREIGVAGGMAGSIRAAICAVLVAIYTVTLTNRLGTTIPAQVPPALISAGLPAESVPGFLQAVAVGSPAAFSAVPGISDKIIEVGMRAYKVANADAFRTVYLVSIAFSGIAVILTFFAPNTEKLMSQKIVATLHNEGPVKTDHVHEKTVEADHA